MSKKNLTTEQKSILKLLETEFEKINAVTPKANGLIDIGSIIHTATAENNFEREVQLAQQAYQNNLIKQVRIDADSIKGDLDALGLKVIFNGERACNFYVVLKSCNNIKDMEYNYIYVNYVNTHHIVRKFNDMERHINCQYGVKITNDTFGNVYKTFADAMTSKQFKERLTSLYKRSLEKA